MDCQQDAPELSLAALLSFISKNSMVSHWYRMWDRDEDSPNPEVRRLMDADELTKTNQLNQLSLQRFAGIDDALYMWLLKSCGLLKEAKDKISISKDRWKAFFTMYDIDAEIEQASPMGTNKRWYIRLGQKRTDWYPKVTNQVKGGSLTPPRCPGIEVIGRRLNKDLRIMFDVEKYRDDDEGDGWGDTSKDNSGDDCNNTNTNCTGSENNNDNDASATAHTTQAPSSNTAVPAFPVLQRFGLADIDLTKEEDNNRFKRLLGELIAKQQQHSGRRNAIEYIQPSQNVSTTAIAVRSHKSQNTFENHHRRNPYLSDVVATLDDDEKVGAQRLSDYLAKEHPNEFVEAAKSSGVAVCGVLDKTEGAALLTDAGLVDEQWNTIMRHLRHKFGAKIAVPLKQVKAKCHEGCTEPQMKIFNHRAAGKEEEVIIASYQSIKQEFKKAVETVLRFMDIKSRRKIKRIRLIVGGDHGQGAFRLGFRVVINTEDTGAIHKTVNIATVHCKKEEGEILESAVIDWLAEDLKFIHDNPLHLLNCNGRIVTCYESEMENPEDAASIPFEVEQCVAGDLAWECFCLGKEGAANHWCIYCQLDPSQWSMPDHDKGECWTIDKLNEMADSNKKGAKRMGVKRRTYFPWIPIENYILPVLHLCIGLGNDAIDYFGYLVEWRLTKLSQEERAWKDRVDILNNLIPQHQQAVKDFNASANGKRRTALMASRRAKAQTNESLSQQEVAELEVLDRTFATLGSSRDSLKAEKKDLLKKISAAHEARRKPPDVNTTTWYLRMERIYRESGVVREDYHKRKFSGRPLKEIMRKSDDIFNKAKAMIREFKDDGVDAIDTKIDEACDRMISLMTSWGKVFKTFYTENPSEADMAQFKIDMDAAVEKHRELRALVDDNDDTPKLHYAGDHGADALERHSDLLLLIEEWVELLHQTEKKKVEDKVKRIGNPLKRVQAAAGKRSALNNGEIQAQIRRTKRPRGSYKKEEE